MTIGQRLLELRLEAGLTQPEMAALADTSKQYVSQLEKGANKIPNGQMLEAWARHFGVSIQWLATGKGPRTPSPAAAGDAPAPTSHPVTLDPEILAAAIKLIRLTFRHLEVAHDPEEDGVPTALAYQYLVARQQSVVSSDNVVDFGKYLRKALEAAGDEGITGTRGTGEGHRRASPRRKAG
ncbi:MAG TPA: helix-turn-helix transcriptional regulator [Stenotrophomonas sp.]|nr:helix-turn-helix transcriptional regulator [Stenotrophomonas sp.]